MLQFFKSCNNGAKDESEAAKLDTERLNQLIELQIERQVNALAIQYASLGLLLILMLSASYSIYHKQ